jgi:hypothetical protein
MKTTTKLKLTRISIVSITISTFLSLPLAFNYRINPAAARLDDDAAAKIDTILNQANNSNNRNNSNNSNSNSNSSRNNSSNKRSQSMEYLRRGLVARKAQENSQALEYFAAAAKADSQNAFAFMALATTLGHSTQGLSYMRTAMTLFDRQGNKEAYRLAKQWLEQKPPSEGF